MGTELEKLSWEKVPNETGACPLAKLKYRPLSCCHAGRFYVGCSSSAELWVWDEGWSNPVPRDGDTNIFSGSNTYEISGLVSAGESLYAVGNRGEVLRWDDEAWVVEHRVAGKVFTVVREESLVCYDEQTHRIIVWGGNSSTGRPGNDGYAFSLEKKTWKKFKRGPKPARDFELADSWVFVHPMMTFDTATNRMLRIGYEEFWILEGEAWEPFEPVDFQEHVAERDRAMAHDRLTKETLILDFRTGNIVRYGRNKCELLGRAELPDIRTFSGNKGLEARAYQHTWIFNAETRRLEIQNVYENEERFSLDLSPAFDFAARKSGE